MKIVTNFSQFPEFKKVDEDFLKKVILKHFPKIKRSIYIYINPQLKLAYGQQTVLCLKDFERYYRWWTPDWLEEVKKTKGYFHKISLSYEHLWNAFHNTSESKKITKLWGLRNHYEFKESKYPHAYLFHVLGHELQHAQQVEPPKPGANPAELSIQYKSHNWKQYLYLQEVGCASEVEFDAELGGLKKGPRMLRSYCE